MMNVHKERGQSYKTNQWKLQTKESWNKNQNKVTNITLKVFTHYSQTMFNLDTSRYCNPQTENASN